MKNNINTGTAVTYYADDIRVYYTGTVTETLCTDDNSYRYGFNGQEKDDEVYGVDGTSYTAEYWQYDSRLGRRWNFEPVDQISISNYACFMNNPLFFVDMNGDESDGWVETEGQMLWDDRVVDQESASQFYGDRATYREVCYSCRTASNEAVILSSDRHFTINGIDKVAINATPDVVGEDIMNQGWGRFLFYFENLGMDYFFNIANRNYNDNANGTMAFAVNNIEGVGEAIRISQMTHDWVGPLGNGWA